ncbi:MAG: RNA-binding protein [Spirochaetes bacterium GWF1_31_7]|nr:MAG: RNA-binding protein [Spirochaetes bacterium GWE1_32_154]OHD47052.1 MAG: RNA-binding protein [Spirochaetes bacterium GWE2_31_10]OHD53059.1 MAG: RNA-binding protein [Spirochaetes bacterium GWF1_31_7]OHD82966.1 MAG: RNA-binding protein [Spirochaetes bacterium RIFOXYB1_FULL_32_8]HBD94821.1 RNA-binding protein [Spirochaetia bacterium]
MGTKIYVGNMNYGTTEDALHDAFSEFGEVVSVKIIMDRMTGRPKGFAFVEMATDKAAQDAINGMNEKELEGRMLRVNEANDKPERPSFQRH